MIGGAEDVKIVFDNDDGVPFVNKGVEDGKEFCNVVGVEADSGLVEEVEGFPCAPFGEFTGEAETPCFSSGKRLDFLPKGKVTESDGDQGFNGRLHFRDGGKEVQGIFKSELKKLSEVFPFIGHF